MASTPSTFNGTRLRICRATGLRRGRRTERGFTLIEIGVVLALVLLLVSMAGPSFRQVTGIQARTDISRLASDIRATRGHAAVSGQTCRMVFCLSECWTGADNNIGEELSGESSYWTECREGQAVIEAEQIRNGRLEAPDKRDDYGSEASRQLRRQLEEKARFGRDGAGLKPRSLAGVRIVSVWTGHQEEALTAGRAYLYFKPSGLTEHARVVLDSSGEPYTIDVSPLSGRVRVFAGRSERPDRDEEED